MRQYRLADTKINVTSKIVCNMCGREMDLDAEEYEEYMTDTMHRFQISYGYASMHDGEIRYFDLCEACLETLFDNFDVPPDIEKFG